MSQIQVLVVDDHRLFRSGITNLLNLEDDFNVVAEAENGNEAITKVRKYHPGLVLMDLQMPGSDGISAIKIINQEFPDIRIVVLTAFDDDEYLFEAIAAGAVGYLLKDTSPEGFIRSLRGVFKGEAAISHSLSAKIVNQFVYGGLHRKTGELDALTVRELQVLKLLARGLSNKEIGEQLVISESTAKNHVHNIMHKLNVDNRVLLTAYALQKKLLD